MNIAIIPARGGSKRIPRKNIKDFCGQPIIKYSLDAAQKSELFDKIIVSTDDAEIAEVARKCGAEIPFIRPDNLSDDFATTSDVILHALECLSESSECYEFVCAIYPTAPFINPSFIIKGYNVLKSRKAANVFAATNSAFPVHRMFKINENERCEMLFAEHWKTRSQDLEEVYHDAGQFYWSRIRDYGREPMFGNASIPLVLPRYLVEDIDTEADWTRAEIMYKTLRQARLIN